MKAKWNYEPAEAWRGTVVVGKAMAPTWVASTICHTETTRPVTSRRLDQSVKSPQGRGRSGNKPLMRNRSAKEKAIPTGSNLRDIL